MFIFIYLPVYLPICLSICLPACLSACLSLGPCCLSPCLPVYLSICLPVCLPICLSVSWSLLPSPCFPVYIFVSVCLSARLPVWLSLGPCCLSPCLPVCKSVCLLPLSLLAWKEEKKEWKNEQEDEEKEGEKKKKEEEEEVKKERKKLEMKERHQQINQTKTKRSWLTFKLKAFIQKCLLGAINASILAKVYALCNDSLLRNHGSAAVMHNTINGAQQGRLRPPVSSWRHWMYDCLLFSWKARRKHATVPSGSMWTRYL